MKRTRKWEYVKQEATRLAELGLGSREIGERIGVATSTVHRWFEAGKIERRPPIKPGTIKPVAPRKTPAEWAESVRAEYQLSETDEQLVCLAESALGSALDPRVTVASRNACMKTFQSLARQLALLTRVEATATPAPPVEAPKDEDEAPKPAPRVLRPTGTDPRIGLMMVPKP